MATFIYVDNFNVWIEGMRWAAVMRSLVPDVWAAAKYNVIDRDWRLDFGKLLALATSQNSGVKRALLVGSRPPPNDSLWESARKSGFEVEVYDRNAANKEKEVDVSIAAEILEDSYEKYSDGDQFILMAGDRDYVPALKKLARRGIVTKVMFWDHASSELKQACTEFISLNSCVDDISL